MKKYLAMLSLIVLVLSAVACGSSAEETKEPSNVTVDESSPAIDQTEPEEEAAEDQAIQEEATIEDSEEVSIEEQVIFEGSEIIITAKSLDFEDSFFGPALKLMIENNGSQNITVQIRNLSINNIMIDSVFSSDISAGKKANDEITFMSSSLKTANIETIKDIEFYFHIFDTDSWDTLVDSQTIHIQTTADASFVQEFDDSGFIAVESNGIRIIVKKLESEDSFWGADLYVYIENNSNQNVTVQTRNVSINGFMVDPIFSCDIVSGKVAFDSITFLESDLTENSISDITTIELQFHVFNTDSWDTILDSEIVNISFE